MILSGGLITMSTTNVMLLTRRDTRRSMTFLRLKTTRRVDRSVTRSVASATGDHAQVSVMSSVMS